MRTGFTLIELLVVVLIIGILSAIALPQYEKTVERARAAEGLQMVASIARANEVYKLSTGSYATDISMLDIDIPGSNIITTPAKDPRKETKLFQYGTRAYSYLNSSKAIAHRLPQEEKYSLVVLTDNTIICYPHTPEYQDFCRSLGSGKKYDFDAYIVN